MQQPIGTVPSRIKKLIQESDGILLMPVHHSSTGHMSRDVFYETHIIIPSDAPGFYCTLSGSPVTIRNSEIRFKGGSVNIVKEERMEFNGGTTSGIPIYYIDKAMPLQKLSSIKKSRNESSSSSLAQVYSVEDIVNEIPKLKQPFADFQEELTKASDRIMMMDSVEEVQQAVRDIIDKLAAIFLIPDRKQLEDVLKQHKLSMDNVYEICDTYVSESTYEIVYFKVCSVHKQQDYSLMNAIGKIKYLDFIQMGLHWHSGFNISKAIQEFRNISILRTPWEKMECLVKSIRLLSEAYQTTIDPRATELQEKQILMNADLLIPALVIVVIQSDVLNLHANSYYMSNFSFERNVESGEYGFALSTLEGVMLYIEQNADKLYPLSEFNQAFFEAVETGNEEELKNIYEKTVQEEPIAATPVMVKSPSSATSITDLSISPLDFLRIRNMDGENAVLIATKNGRLEALKYLISIGFSPNIHDYAFRSPLHWCAEQSETSLAEFLFSLPDLRVNTWNMNHETPLYVAVKAKNKAFIELLLKKVPEKVDIKLQDKVGNTVLHYADSSCLKILLNLNAKRLPLNRVNDDMLTPMLYHAHEQHLGAASVLICHPRVKINQTDAAHRTCLHIMSFHGHYKLVDIICQREDLDINKRSVKGNTALHAATEMNHLEAVKSLLKNGIREDIRNLEGKRAVDLTSSKKIQNLLDDYSLLHQKADTTKIARVVRMIDTNPTTFVIKSAQLMESPELTTVKRTMEDFIFIRDQLLDELSELTLPNFDEFVDRLVSQDRHNHQRASSGGEVVIYSSETSVFQIKLIHRINAFLDLLMCHPILRNHELVWEFLIIPKIDHTLISSRTHQKITSLIEEIAGNTTPTVEFNDEEGDLFRNMEQSLEMYTMNVKRFQACLQGVFECERSFCTDIPKLQFEMCKPSSTLFSHKYVIGHAMETYHHAMENCADVLHRCLLLWLNDFGNGLSHSRKSIQRHWAVTQDYEHARRRCESLYLQLKRIQTQYQGTTSESRVKKLEEAEWEYKNALEDVHQLGALLNYTNQNLKTELAEYRRYLAHRLDNRLLDYAETRLSHEETFLTCLEELIRY